MFNVSGARAAVFVSLVERDIAETHGQRHMHSCVSCSWRCSISSYNIGGTCMIDVVGKDVGCGNHEFGGDNKARLSFQRPHFTWLP